MKSSEEALKQERLLIFGTLLVEFWIHDTLWKKSIWCYWIDFVRVSKVISIL